jgi:pyruvate/2-oxoglutarate dehydrogenase complex dihydrolipoamide dehydrogenase (E3) component
MERVKKRKDKIVLEFRNGSQKGLQTTENLDLIFGDAAFTGEKTISVKLNEGGIEELTAPLFFINTGGKSIIPEIDGLSNINYLTSTSILELDKAPGHLLILGGNYIGLEFGQMFRRFGSKVTILERSERLISREDEDVSEAVNDIMAAEKIEIFTNTVATHFEAKGKRRIVATLNVKGAAQQIKCSHVLVAVGRAPQTDTLGLDKAGIDMDDKGFIKVNDHLETNVPGIYAMGDVKGGPAFTHISYNDYTIIFRNLLEGANLSIKNRPVPYCMFTDPQLGRIGLSEQEAQKKGINFKVAKLPMAHVARAIETGDTRGFMKAIIDPETKKILGVTVLGQEGGEIMTVLQMAMEGGITYDQLRYAVFAHPLYAESINNLFMTIND